MTDRAREIAHKYIGRCTGGLTNPASGTVRYHTETCDALAADIKALIEVERAEAERQGEENAMERRSYYGARGSDARDD